ncbi:MAG: DUF362 domain-containing protein [Candidatus Aenigmatarchaeota archaeon]
MADVYFFNKNILIDLEKTILFATKKWKGGVAVKVHFGEYGNLYHVRPQIISTCVKALKKNKLKPFVFDTLVAYNNMRNNVKGHRQVATMNGFTRETMGCPVKIGTTYKTLKTEHLSAQIDKNLYNVKNVLVISHAKGHSHCAGFGGAIKNMGMGFATAHTKNIMHAISGPKLVGRCRECGTCVKVCPTHAISLKGGWHCNFERGKNIDLGHCIGCGRCVRNCPYKALAHRATSLGALLAEVSEAGLQNKKGKLFVNVAMNITKECDCCAETKIVCKDIGLFASKDPVAVDMATINAIKKACPEFFSKIQDISPMDQIKTAEKLRIGKKAYVLELI